MKRCITNLGATDPDYRLDRIAFMERKLAAFKYHHRKSFSHNYRDIGKYNNGCHAHSLLYTCKFRDIVKKEFSYLAKCLKDKQYFNNPLIRGRYRNGL